MKSFRVWLRPGVDFCGVRVEGRDNTKWLLLRLSESFVFKTFDSEIEEDNSRCCTFQVPFNPPLSKLGFARILSAIPEVTLLHDRT